MFSQQFLGLCQIEAHLQFEHLYHLVYSSPSPSCCLSRPSSLNPVNWACNYALRNLEILVLGQERSHLILTKIFAAQAWYYEAVRHITVKN